MFKPQVGVSISAIKLLGFIDGEYRICVRPEFYDNLLIAKECGFDYVEVGISGPYFASLLSTEILDEIVDKILKSGIKVTLHMPFGKPWNDLATQWDNDRLEIVKFYGKIMDKFKPCKPLAFVFHPGGQEYNENNKEKVLSNFYTSVEELTKLTDAKICIENMVRSNICETVDQMLALLENAPSAYCVLDVNHLLHDKTDDAILRIGKKLKHLHISDYDFIDERHMMPGDGKIDWMKVLACLDEIGYDGIFNYEISAKKYGYTIKDIKDNYERLFEQYNAFKK